MLVEKSCSDKFLNDYKYAMSVINEGKYPSNIDDYATLRKTALQRYLFF